MTKIYDISNYKYKEIIQELFSCEPRKPDWKKDLDELESKNLFVKNTNDFMKTTIQYVRMEGNKLISKSNTGEEVIDLDNDDIAIDTSFDSEMALNTATTQDLKSQMFQFKLSCNYSNLIYDYIKTTYKEYIDRLDKIPTLIEGLIHIIPPKSCVPPHIDQENISEKEETQRANIVLSLNAPENSFIKVDDEVYYPKDVPALAFNAQYIHSAHNYSNEDWVLIVLHIPTVDIKET